MTLVSSPSQMSESPEQLGRAEQRLCTGFLPRGKEPKMEQQTIPWAVLPEEEPKTDR